MLILLGIIVGMLIGVVVHQIDFTNQVIHQFVAFQECIKCGNNSKECSKIVRESKITEDNTK